MDSLSKGNKPAHVQIALTMRESLGGTGVPPVLTQAKACAFFF